MNLINPAPGTAVYSTVVGNFSKIEAKINNVGFSYILKRTGYRNLDNILLLCDKLNLIILHLVNYLVNDTADAKEASEIITV